MCVTAYITDPVNSDGCMKLKECGTNWQWPILWQYVTINYYVATYLHTANATEYYVN
jgi:hypothetical protein